jgi:hypothetical protein
MSQHLTAAQCPLCGKAAIIDPRANRLQIQAWIHGDAPMSGAKAFCQSGK